MTQVNDSTNHGTLCDYETGEDIRPATAAEQAASVEAAQHDGGAGVIEVGGRSCYVEDGEDAITDGDIRELMRGAGDAGDLEQVAVCHLALGHDRDYTMAGDEPTALTAVYDRLIITREDARAECARVIAEARVE